MTPPKIYPNFEGLEYLTTAVIICDTKFLVLYINPSTEALLEISNDQACSKSIEIFLDDVEFFKHAANTARESQSAFRENEFFIKAKHNKTICVTLTVTMINNGANYLIEMIQMDQQVKIAKEERMFIPVSYTHLTLPTICSV